MATTITHTNGFPVFSRLKTETQERVQRRFNVPTDEPYLYIDQHERPFVQRPNEARFYCSIRPTALIDGGFHGYSRKNQ